MSKEEIKGKIGQIPLFELKNVAIGKDDDGNWVEQEDDRSVAEVGSYNAICYVSKRYQLVQFKDVFLPIVDGIDTEADGRMVYFNGQAILDIFPEDDEYKDKETRFGIAILNSVNTSTSLVIRFSALHDNRLITIPESIAGIKKSHANSNIQNIAKTYSGVMVKVRQEWQTIIERFPKIIIDEKQLKEILNDKKLDLTDAMKNYIKRDFIWKLADSKTYSIWDFFISCIDSVGRRTYKTDYHKRQQVDKIIQKILEYGFLSKF